MRLFIATLMAFVSCALSAAADPADTVVVCQLTAEKAFEGKDLVPQERPIQQEFVLKFNDAEKRVTYIVGEAIVVKPTGLTEADEKKRFENEILFLGDSAVDLGGLTLRYSGEISRLTGKIIVRQLYLNSRDHQRNYDRPMLEKTGTCVAGPRKF